MIRDQLCRQGSACHFGAAHIETPLEPDDLSVTLKQPDFLVTALDIREYGFQGGSRNRYVSELLQWTVHDAKIVKF